ncbi:vanadium-dependent haloperoxidase [Variovorax sp. J22R133]|uniref:vanadium-dependent haloperoxidase n=1 Tax=Variovorax brevis TaxID=3053503 RepID=UPI0025756E9B|nr:vanadium-dependent haloperoxidase [Variovorax sp. J22R133]MDM0117185.1 vanadium-dependent haloperoxidase [Variovorax sp. J22R133]
MNRTKKPTSMALLVAAVVLLAGETASADAVTDWSIKAGNIVVEAKLGPPAANRTLAIVQTAVYDAANAITGRYPTAGQKLETASGASTDAAIAAANRATLTKLVPSQQASIDSAYQTALAALADGPAKSQGIAVGEQVASAVLFSRADDGAGAAEAYRPRTTAGVYVPTVIPAASQWPQRKPWLMTSASQFRPGPPPKLTSELWARDYAEIKAVGGKTSTQRTTEQTEIARFWEDTMPPIYHGVVRSVANMPGREPTQNARLFMAVTQGTDDALIAVFEAKYYYSFWRPVTAIRNGDIDGNDATERDPSWTPFIDTPMHPEYPCAHCIVSATVGTVLKAEVGSGPIPPLTTTSATAKGVTRSWATIDDFMQEVATARIYDGVHYRNSTEVGTAMGKQIGELAAAKYLRPPK